MQEGETPSEDPASLLKEFNSCVLRLEYLVTQINITNSVTIVDGETLTAKLSRRDALNQRVSIMTDFVRHAGDLSQRTSYSSIRIVSAVPVAKLQKELDNWSQKLRQLDERIQAVELIEN